MALRLIAANLHAAHNTIAKFRKRFLPQLRRLFVQILKLTRAMRLLKVGNVSLNGSQDQGERLEALDALLRACEPARGAIMCSLRTPCRDAKTCWSWSSVGRERLRDLCAGLGKPAADTQLVHQAQLACFWKCYAATIEACG